MDAIEIEDAAWHNRHREAKARYDRYVCAVAKADIHGDLGEHDIAEQALDIMLAADKRWEEYMKGGNDEAH